MESPRVRRAGVGDIEELLRLRRVMFRGMEAEHHVDDGTIASRAVLEQRLPDGTIVAAVIDKPHGGGLCGAGLLQVQVSLGTPRFPKGRTGHLSSIAVDPEARRQGRATEIVEFLVDVARSLELERVELHSTLAAEPIYRGFGFADRDGGLEMRLAL